MYITLSIFQDFCEQSIKNLRVHDKLELLVLCTKCIKTYLIKVKWTNNSHILGYNTHVCILITLSIFQDLCEQSIKNLRVHDKLELIVLCT